MKIDLLCSSADHPINSWLGKWMQRREAAHKLALSRRKEELTGGDILFLISCTELISSEVRNNYRHTIVLHASDLPGGRGWSPHIWAILEGADVITVSAIDAEEKVDSGAVWAMQEFSVAKHALYDEINASLFDTEMELMDQVIGMVERGEKPRPQSNTQPTYYPRRKPSDSNLDPNAPIVELFDRIRVCDPERYPAFFKLRGHVYSIQVKKVREDE